MHRLVATIQVQYATFCGFSEALLVKISPHAVGTSGTPARIVSHNYTTLKYLIAEQVGLVDYRSKLWTLKVGQP